MNEPTELRLSRGGFEQMECRVHVRLVRATVVERIGITPMLGQVDNEVWPDITNDVPDIRTVREIELVNVQARKHAGQPPSIRLWPDDGVHRLVVFDKRVQEIRADEARPPRHENPCAAHTRSPTHATTAAWNAARSSATC